MTSKDINKVKQNMDKQYGSEAAHAWKYYKSDRAAIPIYNRRALSKVKEMSQVNVHADFAKTIVEQKVGYIGKAVVVLGLEGSLKDRVDSYLKVLSSENEYDTLSPESIRWTSATGISHRLLYFQDNKIYMKNLRGEQVAYIGSLMKPDMVFVFDEYQDVLKGVKEERLRIYDNQYVYYYKKYNNKWIMRTPEGAEQGYQAHLFFAPPIIPFLNNEELESDVSSNIRALINAYDETQSNVLSEIKAHRLATLKMWGDVQTDVYRDSKGNAILDNDGNPIQIPLEKYLEEGYAMRFPTDDDGKKVGGAEFLTKELDDAIVEHNLDRVRAQIFEDASAVDQKSIIQGSNIRVLAINAAYDAFYKKCDTFKKYMTSSLKRLYGLVFDRVLRGGVDGLRLTEQEYREVLLNLDVEYEDNVIKDPEVQQSLLRGYLDTLPVQRAYEKAGFENAEVLAQQYLDQQGLASPLDISIGK